MFPLHERLRRRICIAAFLLVCVLPTVLVLGWAGAWSLPAHVRAEADRIGRRLGMEVTLGRVEHLRPGAVRLSDVTVRDLEQADPVLRCEQMVAERKTIADDSGQSRRVLRLHATAANVDARRLGDLSELARRALRLRAGNLEIDVQWIADSVELTGVGAPETLTAVRGAVQPLADRTEAWMEFSTAQTSPRRPVMVRVGRNRQLQPVADWFVLETRGAALRCDLLGRMVPPMASLGEDARFRGFLRAESTAAGWNGRIGTEPGGKAMSELLDVEWDRLVTDRFPHRLSGKGRVLIEWASFRAGRLEQARGWVHGEGCTVSPSLLNAAAANLGLEQPQGRAAPGEAIPMKGLALRFELDSDKLSISPWSSDSRATIVVAETGYELLRANGRSCPVANLARAMVPEGTPGMPVTRQTGSLLRYLPLPEAVPAGDALGHSRWATEGASSGQRR